MNASMNFHCQDDAVGHYSEKQDGACPDMLHIRDKIDGIGDQLSKLTELMERQVRLEEQSASHGEAVGRAFGELSALDKRIDKLEDTEAYFRGGVKFASIAALAIAAVLGWGLKSQMDVLQVLPLKLDRIERQLVEMVKVDDTVNGEIQRLKDRIEAHATTAR